MIIIPIFLRDKNYCTDLGIIMSLSYQYSTQKKRTRLIHN